MDNNNEKKLDSETNRGVDSYARSSDLPLEKKAEPFPMILRALGLLILCAILSMAYWQVQIRDDPTLVGPDLPSLVTTPRLPAPNIEFTSSDGRVHKLSEFQGKVILVSFWAHWCAPCLVELPSFAQLHKQFSEDGLAILPINLDEKGSADAFISKLWEAETLPFETFYDFARKSIQAFGVENLPANFVIDRKGQIVFSSIGSNDWNSSTTLDLLQELLAEAITDQN